MANSILKFYKKTPILKDYKYKNRRLRIPKYLFPIYTLLNDYDDKICIISYDTEYYYTTFNGLSEKDNVFMIKPYNKERIKDGFPQDLNIAYNHLRFLSDFYKDIFIVHPDILDMRIPSTDVSFEPLSLKINMHIDMDILSKKLVSMGYSRSEFIYKDGEFALRGMIIDIFPTNQNPVRIIFDDDIIISIKQMDIETQRSMDKEINEIFIDVFYDPYEKGLSDITFNDIIKKYDTIIMPDVQGIEIKGRQVIFEEDDRIKKWQLSLFIDKSVEELKKGKYNNLYLLVPDYNYMGIWHDIVKKHDIKAEIEFPNISEGYIDEKYGINIINDFELYGKTIASISLYEEKKVPVRKIVKDRIYAEGDLVVHSDYGIGKYNGIQTINDTGRKIEVIVIEYEDGVLKIPIIYAGKIYKYDYENDEKVKLDRLKSGRWIIRKNNVKKAVERIIEDLVRLYAKRKITKGIKFDEDNVLQMEMEALFPFEETKDQMKSLKEIKTDMESPYPMDRVLCGEVGYGKTEVAIRASFKAVMSGYQVIVLCPTTVLSEQHYRTFRYRLKNFPYIKIEQLSRFVAKKKSQEIVKKIARGDIDIIIGTHRLLSNDIKFNNPGLLIIDEEHRFGVKHKEKIRMLKENIDTLLITATPIPRTMEMALMKIRDISFINTPPKGRMSVHTEVIHYDRDKIAYIILQEIKRGGQVYFVTDKIKGMEQLREDLKNSLPNNVKIGMAHGRMTASILEKETMKFFQGFYDVFLSTSIMESGIDNPKANTIIINNAHRFGLSQLHQLRGRVGRSNMKAYAYLIVPSMKAITKEARERLMAILRYQSLGSGFNIAVRDLEIRGSGDLLGIRQHGKIANIGYSMYWKIVEDVAKRIKNEVNLLPADIQVDTTWDINIPYEYIKDPSYRMYIYTALSRVDSVQDIEQILEDLNDMMGYIPKSIRNLADIAYVKILASYAGAKKIVLKKEKVIFAFEYTVDMKCIKKFVISNPDINISFDVTGDFIVNLFGRKIEIDYVIDFLQIIIECDKIHKQ